MEINFLKKNKKLIRKDLEIKPDLYWKYILYITFVLIFFSFVFGFYLFIKISKEPVLSVNNTSGQETIKKERINKVLEYFSDREKKSTEILNSPSPIVDPSR